MKPLELPLISIVTPCLNQAAYLEQTLASIHGQGYPRIEHIVMDGGSTDGGLDVIRRWSKRLTYWTSEPDCGQYDAIGKGFARATGDVMAWLNSDDVYLPGALRAVGEIFRDFPGIEWLTTRFPMGIDQDGALIKMGCFPGFSRRHFLRGDFLPGCGWDALGFIQQESTFWRRGLWERAGASFRQDFNYAGDFDLWARFFEHAALYGADIPLGCFRRHHEQKTSIAYEKYLDEARSAFVRSGGKVAARYLQQRRIRLLRSCGGSIDFRKFAARLGLLSDVRNVTYDWGRACWTLESL